MGVTAELSAEGGEIRAQGDLTEVLQLEVV